METPNPLSKGLNGAGRARTKKKSRQKILKCWGRKCSAGGSLFFLGGWLWHRFYVFNETERRHFYLAGAEPPHFFILSLTFGVFGGGGAPAFPHCSKKKAFFH